MTDSVDRFFKPVELTLRFEKPGYKNTKSFFLMF